MRTLLLALVLLLATACGAETAVDSGADEPRDRSAMPTEVPAATGPVRTRNLATVMDTKRPELCLGAIAESWPPQCGGPALIGWSWDDNEMHERQGKIRWGSFAVTGTWDGTSFTVDSAIPAALYDAAYEEPAQQPTPAKTYTQAELEEIQNELMELPGSAGAYSGDGHVFVDVTYDDGSLQKWADDAYGTDVVVISSALVPA